MVHIQKYTKRGLYINAPIKVAISVFVIVLLFAAHASADTIDNLQATINSNAANGMNTVIAQNYDGNFLILPNLFPSNVANGGEDGTTSGFMGMDEKLSSVTTNPYQGSHCIFVQTFGTYQGISSDVQVSPSTTYTFSVYLKGASGGEQANVEIQDNGGWLNDQDIVLTNSWQRFTVTGTTHSNSNTIHTKVMSRTRHGVISFYYDAAQIEIGNNPTVWECNVGRKLFIPTNASINGNGYNLKNISLCINNVSNVYLNNILFDGTVYPYTVVNTFSPINISGTSTNITVNHCVINNTRTGSAGIYMYPINISNVWIKNTVVNDTDNSGYMIISDAPGRKISNLYYINDTANKNGLYSQADPWISGFNIGEILTYEIGNSLQVSNVLVDNCSASNAWESGFHLEPNLDTKNITIRNCVSTQNGNRPNPTFAAGYAIQGAATLINDTAINNYNGYFIYNGIIHNVTDDDIALNFNGCSDINSTHYGTYAYGFDDRLVTSVINFNNHYSSNAGDLSFYAHRIYNLHLNNHTVVNPHGDGNYSILFEDLYNSTINMNYTNSNPTSPVGTSVQFSANDTISGSYDHNGDTALQIQWVDTNLENTPHNINITNVIIASQNYGIQVYHGDINSTVNISNVNILHKYGNYKTAAISYDDNRGENVQAYWKTINAVGNDYNGPITFIPSSRKLSITLRKFLGL